MPPPLLTASITDPIVNFAVDVVDAIGVVGIFILMTFESACVPIPSEATMLFAGFAVSDGDMTLFAAVAAGVLGNVLGSWIAWGVGYYGREELLEGRGGRVGSEPVDGEVGERARMSDRLQEGARRFRFLGDEAAQVPQHGLNARRNGLGRVGVAQQHRREVEDARVHAGASGDTPNSARRSTSAISGRPISAVGSVPSRRRTRAIPSASIFADPAQS